MRLASLTVEGFRGFPTPVAFDLDADAVILSGVNGSGKTSFFDAILWVLCGSVGRLNSDPSAVVSEYSRSGEARVELVLRNGASSATVTRRYDGVMHLTVKPDAAEYVTGAVAEAALIELLWPDAKSAADQVLALSRSLTRATYLQQDSIRDFVEADTDQDRFQVVGELVGVGRVAELQRQLESSRNAWTRATTGLEKELLPLEERREGFQARLRRLGEDQHADVVGAQYRAWASAVAALVPRLAAPENPELLDRTLTGLAELERRLGRQFETCQRALAHLDEQVPALPDMAPLEQAAQDALAHHTEALERLAEVQAQAAAFRQAQVKLEDQQRGLEALARLGLQHLSDHCPICTQPIDVVSTRARLKDILTGTSQPTEELRPAPDVAAAAAQAADAERGLSEASAALLSARQLALRHDQWQVTLNALAQEMPDVAKPLDLRAVAAAAETIEMHVLQARALRVEGERLSLDLARAAEAAQRQQLEAQLRVLEEEIAGLSAALESRRATGDLASRLINALRSASEALVGSELERIEPLLQRMFATVDPHPSFRAVGLLTKTVRGKGQLWTTLQDPTADKQVQDPAVVLSSSQLNVLAVSVFLALNLAIPTLPLQVVALDDPLQSLDNVNLLGLADLLRRVKGSRQVIVSTHDDRLAKLLERKLRPVREGERTLRVDLRGWSTEGPTVTQRELPVDSAPLRLVSTA